MVKNNCKMKVKIHPEKNEILIKTLTKDKIENNSNLSNTDTTNNCCRSKKVKSDNILCECNINDSNLLNTNTNDNLQNDNTNNTNNIIRGNEFSSLINEIVKSDNIIFDDNVNFTNEFINDNDTITQMSNGIISNCCTLYIIIYITILLVIF